MDINDIAIVADYCRKHEFFHASSVFLTRIESSADKRLTICLIYSNEQEVSENMESEDRIHDVIFFSLQDIYTLILERAPRLISIFSRAIPLLDKANIAPPIYSSLVPIRLYNKMSMNIGNHMKQPLTDTSESFSMLFCDIQDIKSFINKTFIPLCVVLKEQLADCRFKILWISDYNASGRSAEITLFSDKIPVNVIIERLQIYLYRNVSELHLGRVLLSYDNQSIFPEALPKHLRDQTNAIICTLSEKFLEQFSREELNDNYRVTKVIYYYLLAAKSFFPSKGDFLNANKKILEEMLDDGISPFTKSLLNHQIVSNARDKLLHEYKRLSDKIKIELWENYSELLNEWGSIAQDDGRIAISLRSMKEIRNIVDKQEKSKADMPTHYFLEFYKLMFQSWDIPYYYRAYIPFCINYLVSYEI